MDGVDIFFLSQGFGLNRFSLDSDGNTAIVHLGHALFAALFHQGDDIAHILLGEVAVLGNHGKQSIYGTLRLRDRFGFTGDLDLGAAADNADPKMFFNYFDVLVGVSKQRQNVLYPFDLQYLFDENSLHLI